MDKAVNERKDRFIADLRDPRVYFENKHYKTTDDMLSKYIGQMCRAAGMKVTERDRFVMSSTKELLNSIQQINCENVYADAELDEMQSIILEAHAVSGVSHGEDFIRQQLQTIKASS